MNPITVLARPARRLLHVIAQIYNPVLPHIRHITQRLLLLGWGFQFSVLISGTPIGSGIPIPFSIPKIPVGFFFQIPLLKN
jgi:hypothetical protein